MGALYQMDPGNVEDINSCAALCATEITFHQAANVLTIAFLLRVTPSIIERTHSSH